jgi:hypothetical protein
MDWIWTANSNEHTMTARENPDVAKDLARRIEQKLELGRKEIMCQPVGDSSPLNLSELNKKSSVLALERCEASSCELCEAGLR